LILDGYKRYSATTDEDVLLDCVRRLPAKTRARFLLTPAGFIDFSWPANWVGHSGWQSRETDLVPLIRAAEQAVHEAVTPAVCKAALDVVDYLVLGADGAAGRGWPYAQMVAIYDVRAERIVHWSGKSFPTSTQEGDLVQFLPVDSHAAILGEDRVLLLDCHDLAVFSPYGAATSRRLERQTRRAEMRQLVSTFGPTLVLHLTHTMDTLRTWRDSWNELRSLAPTIRSWATGILYYRDGNPPRQSLEVVLEGSSYPRRAELDVLTGWAD
jgi:hypothetical protein